MTIESFESDLEETQEWLDSVDGLVAAEGIDPAGHVLNRAFERARSLGVQVATPLVTDYVNTIPPDRAGAVPGRRGRGDPSPSLRAVERRGHGGPRQPAVRRNRRPSRDLRVGRHALRGRVQPLLPRQDRRELRRPGLLPGPRLARHLRRGHSSRDGSTSRELDGFRREVGGGLPSYPHPRRSDFWEFPTVSMGLGLINAAYQARFNRYLAARGIADTTDARVWCFAGDGEMDEPESLAGVALAGREHLDNLIFVVNCNLQRLDGPVRGNAKIIQELEGLFRGAGWNVIKLIWGREWDPLLAADTDGVLVDKMNTTVDGEFQKYRVETRRLHPRALLRPGSPACANSSPTSPTTTSAGCDAAATIPPRSTPRTPPHVDHRGAPTVILAQTVKGWALGPDVEARNATHQIKKMTEAELRTFRDRLELPITDAALTEDLPPYAHPGFDSPEYEYLMERRRTLGRPPARADVYARRRSTLPARRCLPTSCSTGTGDKVAASTTGAFTRLLRNLLRDPEFGRRVVPIVPDEARTFGIDALFRRHKIYAPGGQHYEPVDADLLLSYQEAADGQILEEGITEAGAMASFTAAGTAYATWGEPMLPFFIYYSMFGFHRFADLLWAAGDMRARGFLLGATAGRTTLQGEGLQHCDGHSLLFATAFPNLRAYDPAFAYEVAVIVRDGITRMYGADPEDLLYYLTLYNEAFPAAGRCRPVSRRESSPVCIAIRTHRANAPTARRILASGTAMLAALEAQQMLFDDHDVGAEVWSATSYKALRDDALAVERRNRLHPGRRSHGPLRAARAGRRRRTGRCRDRLRQARCRSSRALDAPAIHSSRHRRLRSVRYSAGACAATSRPMPPTS